MPRITCERVPGSLPPRSLLFIVIVRGESLLHSLFYIEVGHPQQVLLLWKVATVRSFILNRGDCDRLKAYLQGTNLAVNSLDGMECTAWQALRPVGIDCNALCACQVPQKPLATDQLRVVGTDT